MNKAQLVEQLAQERNITKKEAQSCVEAVFGAIEKALCAGDVVKIGGFGNFCVKQRAAREAKNPVTKAPVKVPASKKVAFKQSQALKEKL